MVLLDQLWDDIVAGPQPDRGLKHLKKVYTKPMNAQGCIHFIHMYFTWYEHGCVFWINVVFCFCFYMVLIRWRRGKWHSVSEVSVYAVEPFDARNSDEYVAHGGKKGCVAESLQPGEQQCHQELWIWLFWQAAAQFPNCLRLVPSYTICSLNLIDNVLFILFYF